MATAPAAPRQDLGNLLVQLGLLTPGQLSLAQRHQRETGRPLAQAVVELKLATEDDVTRARAQQVGLPFVRMRDLSVDKSALSLVEPALAHKHLLLPVSKSPDGGLRLIVAAWNAQTMEVATKVGARHRLHAVPALAPEAQLRAAIELYYGPPPTGAKSPAAVSALPVTLPPPSAGVPALPNVSSVRRPSDLLAAALPTQSGRHDASRTLDNIGEVAVDQPAVIQFVNRILADAVQRGASDIHFEPRRHVMDVRYRIDGTLHQIDSVRREFQAACASRVKIMAEMNIAERRLPQDGRIAVQIAGRSIDMRVSSLPTQFGESVVLRILDKTGVRPRLDNLGFSEHNLRVLNDLIRKPHGIFLATGPTGSGKTTTLYSAIQAIHTPDVNIITVEDPIEYELEGIRQSNVNEKAGLTFARQLRAILRQDPDIIYVGEIRDSETAEIAFRAALTGHLVFSTLHCNDAAGAITRLLNMNVDPFLVASSVIGVLAQRLVRKVCTQCARPATADSAELAAFGIAPDSPEFYSANFQSGAGCDLCDGTGYKGRYSVQELMSVDESVRAQTLARAPSSKIR